MAAADRSIAARPVHAKRRDTADFAISQLVRARLRKNIIRNIGHIFPTSVYEVAARKFFEEVSFTAGSPAFMY